MSGVQFRLAVLPEADTWLEATVKKFEEHLLPGGLAPDGAHVEGATFWASTMHYRLFLSTPCAALPDATCSASTRIP